MSLRDRRTVLIRYVGQGGYLSQVKRKIRRGELFAFAEREASDLVASGKFERIPAPQAPQGG